MKKVIVILFLLSSFAFANDYSYFCSANVPSKTFKGSIASLSGFNSFARNIAESVIEKEIKKETNSKFKIKIKNFYSTNILNGEFKSIQATSKKYENDGIYLTNIELKTICPYNHISFENETLYFKENMVLKFSAQLTRENVIKTLSSGKLNKNLASILKKASKNRKFISVVNAILPVEIPIRIDENNKAKLKIENLSLIEEKISFDSYILINKNK